jgi:hypothetical protein
MEKVDDMLVFSDSVKTIEKTANIKQIMIKNAHDLASMKLTVSNGGNVSGSINYNNSGGRSKAAASKTKKASANKKFSRSKPNEITIESDSNILIEVDAPSDASDPNIIIQHLSKGRLKAEKSGGNTENVAGDSIVVYTEDSDDSKLAHLIINIVYLFILVAVLFAFFYFYVRKPSREIVPSSTQQQDKKRGQKERKAPKRSIRKARS